MNQSKLKPLQLIHTAFSIAILLFALVSFTLAKDQIHFSMLVDEKAPFFPLFPIMGIVLTALGFFIFNRQVASVDHTATADEKIMRYQTAFLIRCALIEAGALMNTVAFLLVGNTVFLIIVAFCFLAFIMIRPNKQRMIDALNLQFPDTEKL